MQAATHSKAPYSFTLPAVEAFARPAPITVEIFYNFDAGTRQKPFQFYKYLLLL